MDEKVFISNFKKHNIQNNIRTKTVEANIRKLKLQEISLYFKLL